MPGGEAEFGERCAVGPEPVGGHACRREALPLQQSSRQLQRCGPIAPALDQDIDEDLALVVNRTPQIEPLSADPDGPRRRPGGDRQQPGRARPEAGGPDKKECVVRGLGRRRRDVRRRDDPDRDSKAHRPEPTGLLGRRPGPAQRPSEQASRPPAALELAVRGQTARVAQSTRHPAIAVGRPSAAAYAVQNAGSRQPSTRSAPMIVLLGHRVTKTISAPSSRVRFTVSPVRRLASRR